MAPGRAGQGAGESHRAGPEATLDHPAKCSGREPQACVFHIPAPSPARSLAPSGVGVPPWVLGSLELFSSITFNFLPLGCTRSFSPPACGSPSSPCGKAPASQIDPGLSPIPPLMVERPQPGLPSLGLSFPICKMGVITVSTMEGLSVHLFSAGPVIWDQKH